MEDREPERKTSNIERVEYSRRDSGKKGRARQRGKNKDGHETRVEQKDETLPPCACSSSLNSEAKVHVKWFVGIVNVEK